MTTLARPLPYQPVLQPSVPVACSLLLSQGRCATMSAPALRVFQSLPPSVQKTVLATVEELFVAGEKPSLLAMSVDGTALMRAGWGKRAIVRKRDGVWCVLDIVAAPGCA